ncbi:ribonuclease H-like domain-containing protein [Cuneatibacter caecimuris]|uniref:YprB ribonuclease H-like domain-containing protein n=1 Tax=Cuneatibacter caecimuris TaxID=1796618 RepID=A0A4Q7PJX6_9FIRM|nr:ribonuclease H-like domain-containing protein [Cuneatibacter caecimuris]RZT01004.1 hypothetical protein EV209_1441 [Cuneatibacter caecimuris]
MITNTINFSPELSYNLEKLGPAEQLLFFDIETTGFTPSSSSLYLIGCAFMEQGTWKLTQWFAESLSDECEILRAFFRFASRFRCLVHFNGDGFDLPYLQNCCRQYQMDWGLSALESVDLYKLVRPCRQLLGLSSIRLKACEAFLGLRRKDPFNGGQLIAVYEEYLQSRDFRLLRALLLHNEEDIKGMFPLMSMLHYADCLCSPPKLLTASGDTGSRTLLISAELSACLPVPIRRTVDFPGAPQGFPEAVLALEGSSLHCSVPLYEGELKLFYPNYKEYYYLPEEDMAVHQSVAEFVDKSRRKKASASTCYTRRAGIFLPQPGKEPVFSPVFRQEHRSKTAFSLWEGIEKTDSALLQSYLEALFTEAASPRKNAAR